MGGNELFSTLNILGTLQGSIQLILSCVTSIPIAVEIGLEFTNQTLWGLQKIYRGGAIGIETLIYTPSYGGAIKIHLFCEKCVIT